jgi:soluble lytic murein transglycosylase-like protein
MSTPLDPYDPIFQAAGQAWNVDPTLLKAVGMQECPTGNPRCVSPAGAQGLMQIMPPTAKGLGIEDPFDPVQSIWGAAKYMDEALTKEGSPEAALLYYHGGPGWRQSYGKESAGYVPAVAGHYKALTAGRQSTPAGKAQEVSDGSR